MTSTPLLSSRRQAGLLERFSRRLSPGAGLALCLATSIAIGGCAGAGFSKVSSANTAPPTVAKPPASMPLNGAGAGMGPSTGSIGIGIQSGINRSGATGG